ncbi:MAG: hypothetical protein ABI612_11625 [Betaproteobacteria bacterium]
MRIRRTVGVVVVGFVVIGYEALIHWAALSGHATLLGPLLAAAPCLIIATLLLLRTHRAAGLVLAGSEVVLIAALYAHHIVPDLTLLYPVPGLLANMLLLWMFGRTLRAGREPLITRVARFVHGALPPDIERYTRHVTLAWSLFFGVMGISSLALFVLAPVQVWSLFANVFTLPLIGAMFICEYVYRVLRYPTFRHVSLLHTARAFRQFVRTLASSEG